MERFPEIQLQTAKVGVFGKLGKLSAAVRPGDRVEIYRPLLADPKAVRKKLGPPKASGCARVAVIWNPISAVSEASSFFWPIINTVEGVTVEKQRDVTLLADLIALAVLIIIVPAILMERIGDQRTAQDALHLLFSHAGM